MISNRERELWRELGWRDFLLALLIIVILVLVYLLVGGFKLDIARTLLLDVIANLIPVSLAFVVSYAFLTRRIQQLKSEQEMEELASRISSNIANMLPALTQEFSLEKFNVNAAKYWAKDKSVDVTENIRLRVPSGERVIFVNNSLAGTGSVRWEQVA